MKVCKRCIQVNTRPGIFFDDNGICGACLWNEKKDKIDCELRFKELEGIALEAKSKSKVTSPPSFRK